MNISALISNFLFVQKLPAKFCLDLDSRVSALESNSLASNVDNTRKNQPFASHNAVFG
jgi:hypothetical protein